MVQTFRPYPPMLAAGLGTFDLPPNMEIYAGDAPVVTDRGQTGAAILQFQAIGRNASNKIVPWNPEARGTVGDAYATGTLTYSGVATAADTVTINGHVITAVANTATPTGAQYKVGLSASDSATNLVAYLMSSPANIELYGVTASNVAGVVTLTAQNPGTVGNAITTTEAGTNTAFGAATLASGSDKTVGLSESNLIGFAAQPAANNDNVPYFSQGCFNYARMIFPPEITEMSQVQLALVGNSALSVGKVL